MDLNRLENIIRKIYNPVLKYEKGPSIDTQRHEQLSR